MLILSILIIISCIYVSHYLYFIDFFCSLLTTIHYSTTSFSKLATRGFHLEATWLELPMITSSADLFTWRHFSQISPQNHYSFSLVISSLLLLVLNFWLLFLCMFTINTCSLFSIPLRIASSLINTWFVFLAMSIICNAKVAIMLIMKVYGKSNFHQSNYISKIVSLSYK